LSSFSSALYYGYDRAAPLAVIGVAFVVAVVAHAAAVAVAGADRRCLFVPGTGF